MLPEMPERQPARPVGRGQTGVVLQRAGGVVPCRLVAACAKGGRIRTIAA